MDGQAFSAKQATCSPANGVKRGLTIRPTGWESKSIIIVFSGVQAFYPPCSFPCCIAIARYVFANTVASQRMYRLSVSVPGQNRARCCISDCHLCRAGQVFVGYAVGCIACIDGGLCGKFRGLAFLGYPFIRCDFGLEVFLQGVEQLYPLYRLCCQLRVRFLGISEIEHTLQVGDSHFQQPLISFQGSNLCLDCKISANSSSYVGFSFTLRESRFLSR